jgi:hypothetical protein
MSQERRRFFRIEDIVNLNAEFIDDQQAPQKIDQFWSDRHRFSIRNEFNYQVEQHRGDLRAIKRKMPELGRYLEFMQDQVNRITEQLLTNEEHFSHHNQLVSLSAQGIAFHSEQPANPGDIAELHLKLNPGGQEVVTFARVISCTATEDKPGLYNLALDFEHIHDADREILAKHVHHKQMTAISAANSDDQK